MNNGHILWINNHEIMGIHNMTCERLCCNREIEFRIRIVKRQLRDWLGEEFEELARQRQMR